MCVVITEHHGLLEEEEEEGAAVVVPGPGDLLLPHHPRMHPHQEELGEGVEDPGELRVPEEGGSPQNYR